MTKQTKGDADMKHLKHEFYVNAVWDEEANVFYTDSNIKGLHIEADTIEEFSDLVKEFAPELVIENHFSNKTLKETSFRDLITPIFFRFPPAKTHLLKTA